MPPSEVLASVHLKLGVVHCGARPPGPRPDVAIQQLPDNSVEGPRELTAYRRFVTMTPVHPALACGHGKGQQRVVIIAEGDAVTVLCSCHRALVESRVQRNPGLAQDADPRSANVVMLYPPAPALATPLGAGA
ncbi:MAG: hypothetical protein M3Y49_01840, partial [Actinomycetota bacterium]|nr:hypothetical protein [Actinomycetota bacterium]